MSWVEKRIKEYNEGRKATWMEKRALEHANPLHPVLAVIRVTALIYGLWVHSWMWIGIGVGLIFLSHLYCWLMGWAEKRIKEYNEGQKATWMEKRNLENANPVHLVLVVIGVTALIYGLWVHSWMWIGISVGLNFLGNLYCWLKR